MSSDDINSRQCIDAAKTYLDKGFSIIPLQEKNKEPAIKWTPYQSSYAKGTDLVQWFSNSDTNIAIVTGKISGIFAIDIDSEQATEYYNNKINSCRDEQLISANNNTMKIKTGSGNTNIIFGFNTQEYINEKIKNLVLWKNNKHDHSEIRIKGESSYIVAPPSVHPNGKIYTLVNGLTPITLSKEQIKKLVSVCANRNKQDNNCHFQNDRDNDVERLNCNKIDEETVYKIISIVKPYYYKGIRNDFVLYFSGWLRKLGVGYDNTEKIINELARYDEERNSRITALRETYEKQDFEQIAGYSRLLRLLLNESNNSDASTKLREIPKILENHISKKCIEDHKKEEVGNKTKEDFVTYKYSQMGKGELHEAIIVNGLPFFLKYNHNSNTFELVEKNEENSRILRPPNIEEYPYTPYSFDSNEELNFFMQKARKVTLDELFKYSKTIFLKYVDQDRYIIILLAADSIWTYFQDLFSASHYCEGVGTNDVGKSSIGYTFEYTGYRVIKGTAISGANYSRVLGSIEPGQCVIIEDEGDDISEDSEKVKILKAGYEYNSKIPKINMNSSKQEQKWYFPFCYKMILAEKSLKEYKARGLVDRTFSFPCRPGNVKYCIKEVVSQNINKSPRLQKLFDELLFFRKLMLCYRLIHYKDLLPEIETGLKNRDQELCKPLLQLFYGTEALKNEIISTLETFVKQRRTRRGYSLEAALYPIIKRYVFSEVGLDHKDNTYSELKQKKIIVKVPFYRIWDYIKEGGIEGQYDEKKNKYVYETVNYGSLYLNSLPTIISNKFAAEVKKQDYGRALIFDIEKFERFEDLYSDSQLKGDNNIKIEVRLKETTDDYDGSDNSDNF